MDLKEERSTRAGCVYLARSRRTGAIRGVYRAAEQGLDTDGGAWVTICEDHGAILNSDTKADALAADTDSFCDDCRTDDDSHSEDE